MINIFRKLFSFCITFNFLISASAQTLSEDTGWRKIVAIGCHNTDGTCFVSLDGAAFGATLGCRNSLTNEFRFDNGDTAIGKRTFAALLAAQMSGKSVAVHLAGCTSQGAPAIQYFQILS